MEINKHKFKWLKRITIFLFILIIGSGSLIPAVNAAEDVDYVTSDTKDRQPIPKSYNVVGSINNIGDLEENRLRYFNDPQDIFIDGHDNVFVVDTGNNRIVKLNSDMEALAVYTSPDEKAFNAPQGIYVDDNGDMYVADTGNARIVHMSPDGELVEIFYNPSSSLVGNAPFTPTKLIISNTGYIYVIRGENIMAIDGNNEFRGFYGQTNIGYSLAENLVRIFGSEYQKLAMRRRTASSYINVSLGQDGMIYATSFDRAEGELKQLNSVGTNVYKKYTTVGNEISNPVTDFIKNKIFKSVVAGQSFKFGEYFDDEGNYFEPIFRDISVDKNGIITVMEELTGKIYQYDHEGNMLCAFGGNGERQGEFTRASSLGVNSEGRIFVVDRLGNNIQYFDPTDFILSVHEATIAYEQGQYDLAYDKWSTVLELNENYELAHAGMSKAFYKQGNYESAMKESKLANNRDLYTQAFDEYTYVVLRENFTIIVAIAIAIIVLVYLFLTNANKLSNKAYWKFMETREDMGVGQGILYSYNVLKHPIDTINGVHNYRGRINLKSSAILVLIAYAVRILYVYIVHYPLASIDLADANAIYEAVKLLIIPFTWIVASFAVTSISSGESKISEITFTTIMAYVPYIMINIPLMLVSNIMSKTQQSWYGVFSTVVFVWMIIIFFLNMKLLNNYSFGKALRNFIITFLVMIVIWIVLGMVYVLSARVVKFVFELIKEVRVNII